MSKHWTPEAGDFIFIEFDLQASHELAGTRPAIVLSEAAYNSRAGLAIVCPVTNQVKGYPFEVPIPSGRKITGVVLSDQLKSVDWKARKARRVDSAPRAVLETVRKHVSLILAIR